MQIYYHQAGHGGPPPLEMMNRWFTRYVYGVENGVENDPRAFIVREGDDRQSPTAYDDYPNPRAEGVELHPSGNGTRMGMLSPTAEPDRGTGELTDNVSFDGQTLAGVEWSTHRLVYATPELVQPLHRSGLTRVKIRVAANAEAANLSVWLVSLPITDEGTINDNIVTRGWADPQNRNSLRESTPLVPGEFVELEFDLQPDDQIIPAGQRLGLMVFSSDREYTLWPEPGTELTVDLDKTWIEIPFVGGTEAYDEAVGK